MTTIHTTPADGECITCTRTPCELPHTCGKADELTPEEQAEDVRERMTIQMAFDVVYGPQCWASLVQSHYPGIQVCCSEWLMTTRDGAEAARIILGWAGCGTPLRLASISAFNDIIRLSRRSWPSIPHRC